MFCNVLRPQKTKTILYKYKGEMSDCFNYWGITPLFIAGKIVASVLEEDWGPLS